MKPLDELTEEERKNRSEKRHEILAACLEQACLEFEELEGGRPSFISISAAYTFPVPQGGEKNDVTYRHVAGDPERWGKSVNVAIYGALHMGLALAQALHAEPNVKNRNAIRRLVIQLLGPYMQPEKESNIVLPGGGPLPRGGNNIPRI